MVHSSNESQQTRTFSIDHENVLPDHYRLIELIGRGGMAEVYLAEDRRLGRKVAIKFLSSEFRRDPDRVRRFRQEARSASALNHPNILIIHDIGDRNDVQFIVSEYVEGETLGLRIAQGRVPFAEAVEIAIQVASALMAAHAAGIVHRDIKPDNIMIRNDGVVKVLDFGLAKARGFTTANGSDFDALTIDSGSTSPGLIVGTPQYMSPEQARGKELDGRTDIFSLGIIIFEMITRHSPFAGGSFADTMAAILTKEPRRIEEFVENAPARLIAIVDKCLRKDRDERFASMAEVDGELKLLRTEVISTPKDTAEIDPAKSDRTEIRPTHEHSIRRFVSNTFQKPSPIAAVIILVAGALLAGGWWAWDRISLRATAPSLMRTVPITSWSSSASELVTSASFSPDGKMVAFAARKGNSTEIWVKPVIGGDAVQVTKNGGFNQFPIWSPDGQHLAFYSDRGGGRGVWRIPFTGGDQTRLVGDRISISRPLLWTPEGSVYFFERPELFRVSAGGGVERITDFATNRITPRTIVLALDEKSIAYSFEQDGIWNLAVKPLASEGKRVIATSSIQIDHIAWHPKGTKVFFSENIEGTLQVMEADFYGNSPVQRSNGDLNYVVHDVSSDGSVLYGSMSEASDLWRLNTQDSKESIVANEVSSEFWPDISSAGAIVFQSVSQIDNPESGALRIVGAGANGPTNLLQNGFMPSWSNKGDSLAFFRRTDAVIEIWRSNFDGIDTEKVSNAVGINTGYVVAPYLKSDTTQIAWSPDDTRIVFPSMVEGTTRLWIADREGTGDGRQLVSGAAYGFESEPVWLPDGKRVIFRSQDRLSSTDGRKWIYRIRIADVVSGQQHQIFESKERNRLLGLSASKKELLFVKRLEEDQSVPNPPITVIYSLSLDSGEVRKIQSLNNAYFLNIHLSKKGDFLAFVSATAGRTSLMLTKTGSENYRELLSLNDPKIMISSLALSPDGSFIVFGKQTRTSLLSMLSN